MRGDTLPAASDQQERQAPRAGAIVTYPDGQIRRRVILTADIDAGSIGAVNVMIPRSTDPYFEDGEVDHELYIPANGPNLKTGDEAWASWEPGARIFFLLSDLSQSTGSSVAKTTQVIPARNGTSPGGPVTCKFVTDETGTLTEGADVEVKSWVGTDSPDPADEWSGYIYISQDSNGDWWYHAVDCVPPPPAFEPLSSGDTIGVGNDANAGVYYVSD